ncbi:MAG TPA: CoA-binding protein [Spirochaetia bacterium]|nr:CoA-binding protein [Spirochaetia bacterium]
MFDRASAMKAMFEPRIVAHVGASETGLYPADVFRSLLSSKAAVFAVNPNRSEVFGERSYPSLAELPERPDLAVITVRAELVPDVLARCVDAAIPAALVFASGFAEAGREGTTLQRRLEEFADKILVLGPNCAGFANISGQVVATRLYSKLRSGSVSFVSQSGALMMALHGSFSEGRVGLRFLVSVGNQLNLTIESILCHFADDPPTKVAAVFLEGISDGTGFVEALKRNMDEGKPVVILRAGRTSVGRRLAETHTAAVAGSARVLEAMCRQFGAVLVDDVGELISVSRLFEVFGRKITGRIAYLTQSGGLGSLTGDLAKLAGLDPRPLSAGLQKLLRDRRIVPEQQTLLNPVDLRGDAMRGRAIVENAAPFFEDAETDVVVLLFAKNPNREVEQETASGVIELSRRYEKPLLVVWVGDFEEEDRPGVSAVKTIRRAGIPVFTEPGAAVRAIAMVDGYYRFRNGLEGGAHGNARVS